MKTELSKESASVPVPSEAVKPRYRVREESAEYVVEVALPGVPKSQTQVALEDGVLRIEGRRAGAPEGWTPVRTGRRTGDFRLKLELGDDIDASAVSASSKDGVLTVRLPKQEKAKSRVIEIA